MNPLAWINLASSLAGDGGGGAPSVPAGSQLSMPALSSADGHSEVTNQFTTGAFAVRGNASSEPSTSGLMPLAIGAAALLVVFFLARKVL